MISDDNIEIQNATDDTADDIDDICVDSLAVNEENDISRENDGKREKDCNGGRGDKAKSRNRKHGSNIKRFFETILMRFKDALYPLNVTCDVCGEELTAQTRYRLCASCTENMPFVKGHRCVYCGVPILDEADYCNRCQTSKSAFIKNRSPLVYEGEARRMIYALKFGKKKYIAQTLGALMADEFLKSDMQADIIAFVPMTQSEEKKRGLNQSELLAYEVGRRLNIPVLPALVKTKDTSAQKELKGKDRAKNLEGAFACVFDEVKNRNMLLIDDIFTTGATANACSEALLKAKARQVCVLTAAVTKLKIPVESKDGTTQM